MEIATLYNADVIVFEHLERGNKLKGTKKQKLHLWKCQRVQSMVAHKAHRLGIRISHVNAWGPVGLLSTAVVLWNVVSMATTVFVNFKTGKYITVIYPPPIT